MTPTPSPLAMAAVRAYEPDHIPSQHEIRTHAARRGYPLDAEEIAALRLIADGTAYPLGAEGVCSSLSIRGYAVYGPAGWSVTTQGEWYLDRIARYAEPLHAIAKSIREAADGALYLSSGSETPVDAWDALTEARQALATAQAKVAEALAVVGKTARKEG